MTATERMYRELERQGKTSSSLCRYLGIKTSLIAGWKEQNTIPPAKYLVRISEFLNVSVDWLLTGTQAGEETPPLWRLDEEEEALLTDFQKLDPKDRREIRALIRFKLESAMGLSSSFQISSDGHSGSTETA